MSAHKKLLVQDVKEIYKDHDERTIQYMEYVVEALNAEYKSIPAYYRISLDLLADQLDVYFEAKDYIKEVGSVQRDSQGRLSKNNQHSVLQATEAKITGLLQAFALTPFTKIKMKKMKELAETEEDSFESLVDV